MDSLEKTILCPPAAAPDQLLESKNVAGYSLYVLDAKMDDT